MLDRFKLRRDTAANWTSTNPVLLDGEPGIEQRAGAEALKIGDGTTPWAGLPYTVDAAAAAQAAQSYTDAQVTRTTGSFPVRRRELPDPTVADVVSAGAVTTTPVAGGAATSIVSGVVGSTIIDGKVTPLGGQTWHVDPSEGGGVSQKFDWKNLTSGVAAFPFPYSLGVQFGVIGSQQVEFKFFAHTGYAYRIEVDGRRLTDIPVVAGLTVNTQNTVRIDLGDTKMHVVKVWLNACALSRVYVGPAGTVWPIAAKGLRWFGLGDSTMQGASAGTGQEADSWLLGFGRLIGADDVWNGAIGGTGTIATNAGASGNYLTRVTTDLAPSGATAVLLGGYYNDLIISAATPAAIAAAYSAILTAIAALPTKPAVLVVGPFDPLGVNGANYTAVEAAILPVFAAKGVPYISPISGNTYDRTGAVVATSAPWVNAANRGVLIAPDNTHQTDDGKKYEYRRVIDAARPLMAA